MASADKQNHRQHHREKSRSRNGGWHHQQRNGIA